jgi:hypothetical protein
MSDLTELRARLEAIAAVGEDELRAALEALGPSEDQREAFEEWLSVPENRERWNAALADGLEALDRISEAKP